MVILYSTNSTDQRKGKRLPRPVRGMHAELVLIVRGLRADDPRMR